MEDSLVNSIDLDGIQGDYIPGVCNIGPAEIKRRKDAYNISLVGAIITGLLYIFLPLSQILAIIGLFALILVGAGSSVNYLQVREKFCVAFGSVGVFNFNELGPRSKITDETAMKADRTKVRKMFVQSAVMGGIYAAVIYLLNLAI